MQLSHTFMRLKAKPAHAPVHPPSPQSHLTCLRNVFGSGMQMVQEAATAAQITPGSFMSIKNASNTVKHPRKDKIKIRIRFLQRKLILFHRLELIRLSVVLRFLLLSLFNL